ncbi:MAG TPA: FG-GAP repeat protein [Thermoanaerobaculia bacterium]|nr:FG-GAP repeat protein [Thermoanaerobaculia bacterium]
MRKLLIFALAALALATIAPAGAESPYPVTELFPVEPEINAERGFAVALDGEWLAMGAPRADYKPDTPAEKDNAGAIYLFHWSGTTWDQKAKLFADSPQRNAQLGLALAMRNGVLAAGAPGEGRVYVFTEGDGVWSLTTKLKGSARAFGRSLALDDDHLAVGAFGVHGATDGAVYLYKVDSWAFEQKVRPRPGQKGERFGSAVSLAGDVLVVGAPGYDVGTGPPTIDAGAVYIFQPVGSLWREKQKLFLPNDPPLAWQQFGSAVATDGTQIFVGAPTAGPAGTNSGAVYRFVLSAGTWSLHDLPAVGGLGAGDQLGASLALSGDLLVAGAPAPPPKTGTGGVWNFRLSEPTVPPWKSLTAGNTEVRDLAGFAVAVSGERVVVGGVLGDQADGAAGAAWSFDCAQGDEEEEEEECTEEAEAVARDPRLVKPYGASVALTEQSMAVGASEEGAVYLYRQVRKGWRQEERLISAYKDDSFGSSVALEGPLLAVGAPQARFAGVSGEPVSYPDGSVDLFVRHGSSWVYEATLAPPAEAAFGARVIIWGDSAAFGTSVAIADGVVAVGAPGRSTVYLFEKGVLGWSPTGTLTAPASGFGSAVSLHKDSLQKLVLVIGAPGAADGAGAVYVSVRENSRGWPQPQPLPDQIPGRAVGQVEERALGSAVAFDGKVLAAGAPGFLGFNSQQLLLYGAVFLFTQDGTTWKKTGQISSFAPHRFGSSVALLGSRLVIGAPDQGDTNPGSNDLDKIVVFELDAPSGEWRHATDLDALQPPHGDKFGAAVALSKCFLVVTSPGPPRGDRVTVFALPNLEECPQ